MLAAKQLFALASSSKPQAEPAFLRERVDTYYRERAVNAVTGGHILKGRIPGADDLILTSNDYLSISRHPAIMQAQAETLHAQGHGVLRSSVFLFGETPQRALERALAHATQAEDALVAQSGWCANTGLIQAIANAETPVYLDMFAHMSLWEGVHAAGATPRPFRHNRVEALDTLIAKHGPGLVIVDSVYSTNGSVCPLPAVVDVATRHGCVILVDESHSLGVFGTAGEGMVAALGLTDQVHFRTASLSKAYAARGGLILVSVRNMEYLRYASRPAIFSSGLLPHELAGLQATLQVVSEANDRREQVLDNARYLRAKLAGLGYDVGQDESQILALVPGAEHLTIQLRDALEARGVFGSVFCDPATPRNRSLIRFTINAAHTRAELARVAAVCAEVRDVVDLAQWPEARKRGEAA
jgi:CAI-1 autoinducer synthase